MSNIVLKDRSGAKNTYSGFDVIKISDSDGNYNNYVEEPTGRQTIEVNGIYDVAKIKEVDVRVPITEQPPIFDGTIEIGGKPATDYIDYYEKGKTEGISEGRQAQYDEFWDKYQNYGKRTDYQYGAFGGIGWTDETYKPKYHPLKPTYAYAMFMGCQMTEILGVDLSLVPDVNNVFYVCNKLTHIGEVNAPLATRAVNTFSYCKKLHTIDKLVISESFTFSDTFYYCESLENLIIEGTIGQAGLNLRWSTKLSRASITSIINALSSTTSGLAVTLSRTAVNAAFETESGAADGSTSDEWINLVSSKTNWTISLA